MTPVTFGDCFGWLHAPRERVGRVGVLICPGLVQDALWSHCSLRLLADQLAEAGYWALRFDYPGTGDSRQEEDVEPEGGYWQAWQRSIDRAADWLVATTGATELVMCGLRAGATLAALAAIRRSDVIGLIQFAPVVRGLSYVRQCQVHAELQNGGPLAIAEQGLTFGEFHFSPATLNDIGKVDLREIRPRAGQMVAMYPRGPSKVVDECVQLWRHVGVSVVTGEFTGLEPLLREGTLDENSLADFSDVLAWLGRTVPCGEIHGAVTPGLPPAELCPPGCIETPLRFGHREQLFGILCRPDGGSDRIVIITNSGRDPHYGLGRQSVTFARQLARFGIASLRMDFAGLGDSPGPDGKENVMSHMFEVDRRPDINAALDALEGMGFRRFALQGLCAGAYHSLHGALADSRISALMLVNLPLFSLTSEVIDYLRLRNSSPMRLVRKLFLMGGWKLLLSGKVDVLSVLRGYVAQAKVRASATVRSLASKVGFAVGQRSLAHHVVATLSTRGVRVLFLFSPGQPEMDAFAQEFGRNGEKLAAYPGAEMHVVPGMDHSLATTAGRRLAQARMFEFMAAGSERPSSFPANDARKTDDAALA